MKKTLSFFITVMHKEFTAFCNNELQKIGLTLGLMYFILYIGKYENCSPKQLAAGLHFDMGHTVRSLDRLEQDGFVLREKNPQDKRGYFLCLTEKGCQARSMIRNLLVEWDELKLAGISPEERAELMRILSKLEDGSGGVYHV